MAEDILQTQPDNTQDTTQDSTTQNPTDTTQENNAGNATDTTPPDNTQDNTQAGNQTTPDNTTQDTTQPDNNNTQDNTTLNPPDNTQDNTQDTTQNNTQTTIDPDTLQQAIDERNKLVLEILERNKYVLNIRGDDLWNLTADTYILISFLLENYEDVLYLDVKINEMKQLIEDLAQTSIDIKNELTLKLQQTLATLESKKEEMLQIIQDIITQQTEISKEYLVKFESLYNSSVETYFNLIKKMSDFANSAIESITELFYKENIEAQKQLANNLAASLATLEAWQQRALKQMKQIVAKTHSNMQKLCNFHEKRLINIRDNGIDLLIKIYTNAYENLSAFVNIYQNKLLLDTKEIHNLLFELGLKNGTRINQIFHSARILLQQHTQEQQENITKVANYYQTQIKVSGAEVSYTLNSLFTNLINAQLSQTYHLINSIQNAFNETMERILAKLAIHERDIAQIKIYQQQYGRDFVSEVITTDSYFMPKNEIDIYFVFMRGGSGFDNSNNNGGITSFGDFKSVNGGYGNSYGRGSAGETIFLPLVLTNKEPIPIKIGEGSLKGVVIISYPKAAYSITTPEITELQKYYGSNAIPICSHTQADTLPTELNLSPPNMSLKKGEIGLVSVETNANDIQIHSDNSKIATATKGE